MNGRTILVPGTEETTKEVFIEFGDRAHVVAPDPFQVRVTDREIRRIDTEKSIRIAYVGADFKRFISEDIICPPPDRKPVRIVSGVVKQHGVKDEVIISVLATHWKITRHCLLSLLFDWETGRCDVVSGCRNNYFFMPIGGSRKKAFATLNQNGWYFGFSPIGSPPLRKDDERLLFVEPPQLSPKKP